MSRHEQSAGSERHQASTGIEENRGRQPEQTGNSRRGNGGQQRGQQPASGRRRPATGQRGGQQPNRSNRTGVQPTPDSSSVPIGFRLISLAFAGVGLALLAGGAVITQGASAVSAVAGPLGSALLVVGLVFGALGVGHLAAGYGVWTFRPWAHRVGLFIAVGSGLGSATVLLAGSPVGLIGLATHGAIAWYLHTNRQRYARLRRAA